MAAGLLASACVLCKNEGLPLALSAVGLSAVALAVRNGKGARLSGLSLVAPPLLSVMLLRSWQRGIPNRFDEAYDAILADSLRHPDLLGWLESVGRTVPVVLRLTFFGEQWGPFFWLVAVVLLLGARRLRRHPASRPLLAAALAPLLVGLLAYALHWTPVELAAVTWYRFLLHAAVPILALTFIAARGELSGTPVS